MAVVSLSIALMGFAAKLTATLQSGDQVTAFYGDSAFVKAYDAAVSGDIITLSVGQFKSTEINKSISVIGSYAFSEDANTSTIFSSITVMADNVTLEGIRFSSSLTVKAADQLTLTRCYIYKLDEVANGDDMYHNNTILTDCFVKGYSAMEYSQNTVLRNCVIEHFDNTNSVNYPALIENCTISMLKRYSYSNSPYYFNSVPYAIYRGCYLGLYANTFSAIPSLTFYAPSELHDCVFHCRYYYSPSSSSLKWSINTGSIVNENSVITSVYNETESTGGSYRTSFSPYTFNSISYGPVDHKAYPAIPTITSSEIDTETDADGNLHVKISATAHD